MEAGYLKYQQQTEKNSDNNNFIGRLQYCLGNITRHIDKHDTSEASYCPSSHVFITTIVKMLPEICKPDIVYNISR